MKARLSKQQGRIVAILGAGTAVMLLLTCVATAFRLQALRAQQSPAGASAPDSAPLSTTASPTPSPAPIFPPTWTPQPTSTPYVPPTPTPRVPEGEEAAVLDQVQQDVAALRGLEALRPAARHVLQPHELRAYYDSELSGPQWEQTITSLAPALEAFGWLAPGTDLSELLRDFLSERIAGFYDARTETIFLVSGGPVDDAAGQITFAHEFGHALQDQHFDLERLDLLATERLQLYADHHLAAHALIEGDAVLIQQQYSQTLLSPVDHVAYQYALAQTERRAWDAAPRVVRETFTFPYRYGYEFVAALYEGGGWEAVNAAYARPPASSEQILHPERYLSGDLPLAVALPSLAGTLGDNWQPVYNDVLGEFLLRLHLEDRLDGPTAALAAEGWGGDRCVVYRDGTDTGTLLLLSLAWDTPGDAGEFLAAYSAWANAHFGRAADVHGEGRLCWQQGQDALCVAWQEQSTTIVRAADLDTVQRVLDGVR